MKRVLFAGGGTAGHVVPVLPLIRTLAQEGVQMHFVGSRSGLEGELLAGQPVTYHAITAGKLRRYFSWENFVDAFRVLGGICQAYRLVGRLRPDVVFSKGGFVSFPVAFAAWLRRVPVVAHESDLTPGLANRLAMPFVRTLCLSFPATPTGRFKGRVCHTGSPVRAELLQGDAQRGRTFVGAPRGARVLLVTGGSLGADALNAAVRGALDDLTAEYHVVHVCGAGKLSEDDHPRYVQYEYLDATWGDVLAAADLVISRAGANTLFELLAQRKPNLLVPLSQAASRGDQVENAAYAASRGYSHVLEEGALTPAVLVGAVRALAADLPAVTGHLEGLTTPDAVALICDELRQFLATT